MRKEEQCFGVDYRVLSPVDQHPCGPRYRAIMARNWVEACAKARLIYGEDKVESIRVDAVSTRDEHGRRQYQFNRFGWGNVTAIPAMPKSCHAPRVSRPRD